MASLNRSTLQLQVTHQATHCSAACDGRGCQLRGVCEMATCTPRQQIKPLTCVFIVAVMEDSRRGPPRGTTCSQTQHSWGPALCWCTSCLWIM